MHSEATTVEGYLIGKSCVRFRILEDLPLELIGASIAALEIDEFVERVRQGHRK